MAKSYFVGSLWHQDSDPFATVVARSRVKADSVLEKLAEAEWENMLSITEEGEEEPEDDIMTSGVFKETADWVREYTLSPGAEGEREWAELQETGYVVL